MSSEATFMVWNNSKTKGFNKLVLLALAESAGPELSGTVRIERLESMTHASLDRLQTSIGYLMSIGELFNSRLDGQLIHFWFHDPMKRGL